MFVSTMVLTWILDYVIGVSVRLAYQLKVRWMMLFPLRTHGKVKEEMSITIKSLKCSSCGIQVPCNDEALELALVSCKDKYREDFKTCSLKHLIEMTQNIRDRQAGKPKAIPRVLQPNARDYSQELDSYVERSPLEYKGYEDEHAWSHLPRVPPRQQLRTLNVDTEKGEFEFEVDDPIVVFIHKNGKVEDRSFEK